MEVHDQKDTAKMELLSLTSELMPAGNPKFLDVINYPKITDLVSEHGRATMVKIIFLMLKDFCSSMNVVRNMNEDQMIEGSVMLFDECDNFRLEDYTMMFALAKKGKLIKIYDRIDIEVLTQIMDAYWLKRKNAAESAAENEIGHLETLGPTMRKSEMIHPQDARIMDGADKLAGAIDALKTKWKNQ